MDKIKKYIENKEQSQVIETIKGPIIVISCPGSGKTTTILRRVENIAKKVVKSNRILVITFSKSAAIEMKDRYVNDNKIKEKTLPEFRTIHSLAYAILKEESKIKNDMLLLENEVMSVMYQIKDKVNIKIDEGNVVSEFLMQYSKTRNLNESIRDYIPKGISKKVFDELAFMYEKWKQENNRIDFDDILILCYQLLKSNDKVLRKYQNRWDYICVDEYQDTSNVQKEIIYLLAEKHTNLCVVGDDDQSIYSFRGALPKVMLNFKKEFEDAKEIYLKTNYRSTKQIIDIASLLISNNRYRYKKEFNVEKIGKSNIDIRRFDKSEEQLKWLVNEVKYKTKSYNETAILYRNNLSGDKVISCFIEENIPFRTNEHILKIYENFIFKDINAYYRISNNTDSKNDWNSILKYYGWIYNINKIEIKNNKNYMLKFAKEINEEYKKNNYIDDVISLFENINKVKEKNLEGIFDVFYDKRHFDVLKKRAKWMSINVEEYIDILEFYRKESRKFESIKEWLKDVDNKKRFAKSNNDNKEGITLSTIHKAKGLEWKNVYIIDAHKMPEFYAYQDENLIEEERRIFYVGITRAAQNLNIGYIQESGNIPPLFIEEISGNRRKIRLDESRYWINKREFTIAEDVSYNVIKNSICVNDIVVHKIFGRGRIIETDMKKSKVYFNEINEIKIILNKFLTK